MDELNKQLKSPKVMSEVKVDLKDNKGRNAMHYAIDLEENEAVKGTLDNVDMVELLIKVIVLLLI